MVVGLILILISIVAFYYLYNSDLVDVVADKSSLGKIKIFIGILILFIVGLISAIRNS